MYNGEAYLIALIALVLGVGSLGTAFAFWWEKRHAEKLALERMAHTEQLLVSQIERLESQLKDAFDRLMSRDLGEYVYGTRPDMRPKPQRDVTVNEDESSLAMQMFGEWEPAKDE